VARDTEVRSYLRVQGKRNVAKYDGAGLASRFDKTIKACIGKSA
jgi:hypothetical protein